MFYENIVDICGFLSESRRTNVAVTRARRHLTMIGDSSTITHEPFIKELIDFCHVYGEVWSAQQYMDGTHPKITILGFLIAIVPAFV